MYRPSLALGAALAVLVAAAATAEAKPMAPQIFAETYPDSPLVASGPLPCTYCHLSTYPASWNTYGISLQLLITADSTDEQFAAELPGALAALENDDSDNDGVANIEEIMRGTGSGNFESVPDDRVCVEGNEDYDICNYDPPYTYKKLWLDFCGESPTYEEMEEFRALSRDAQYDRLHAQLDACLDSEFWLRKNGQLWQIAHKKIRPVGTLKGGSEDRGAIPLADYYDDYHLFVYTQTDDHDARDVLLADYFVERQDTADGTVYVRVDDRPTQPMQPDRRVGLATTAWHLLYNTMFTGVPRTAAAQTYRAFLGFDIAKQQGLYPAPEQLIDYDQKGVTGEACQQCHTTLDAMTRPFTRYNGLQGPTGQYDPTRITDDFLFEGPLMSQLPESGYLMGQPVDDLLDWADVAVASAAFAAATVRDYWKHAIGLEPTAEDDEYIALWTEFMGDDDYRVERMLHALIETEAYGAP